MAWRKDWKKIEATVTKSEQRLTPDGRRLPYTEAEGINPVTGQKQTFTGRTKKKNFLGMDLPVSTRKGEKVDVYVDPDQVLFHHRYDMRKKD